MGIIFDLILIYYEFYSLIELVLKVTGSCFWVILDIFKGLFFYGVNNLLF